jgi:hypothetical protein
MIIVADTSPLNYLVLIRETERGIMTCPNA